MAERDALISELGDRISCEAYDASPYTIEQARLRLNALVRQADRNASGAFRSELRPRRPCRSARCRSHNASIAI